MFSTGICEKSWGKHKMPDNNAKRDGSILFLVLKEHSDFLGL